MKMNKMNRVLKVSGLDGKEITVTDLALALMQADDYRYYRVSNPTDNDWYLYEYWEDIYQKLLLLETEIKNDN
jgi:hypothetical protein